MMPLTHRPLPEDPALQALGDEARRSIALAWRRQAHNELSSSTVFAHVTCSLVGLGAPLEILRAGAAAVADEVRHAEISVHVAQAYWAECPSPEPGQVTEPVAQQEGRERDLADALLVIMQSCVNEGIATAYLQRCFDDATFALARAAVRDILVDEIRHARFGWSFLTSPAMRPAWLSSVAEAFPVLLERVVNVWTRGEHAPASVPPGHGLIDEATTCEVVRAACEQVIVPGLEVVGIDPRPAKEWLAQRRWP